MSRDSKSDFRSRSYRAALLSEDNWFRQANGLLESAQALQPLVKKAREARRNAAKQEPFVWPSETNAPIAIQMMLFSFAFENLLKGSLIQHNKTDYGRQLQNEPALPEDLKDHDLVKLTVKARKAANVGGELDSDDEELLMRLTRRAVWQGRYPVPLKSRDMAGLNRLRSGEVRSMSQETSTDPWDAVRLFNELSLTLGLQLPRASRPATR